MIWRGMSLRYGTGEKKVNEVDFISQGVELISRKLEIQLEHEKEDEFSCGCVKVCMMVGVGDCNRLLEEVEVSLFVKKVMILDWMFYVSILVLRTFLVFLRSWVGGVVTRIDVGIE
ncbi:hypothetical protein Tco_1375647 [Tanacetum coccineum]